MLGLYVISFRFFRFIQSGMYLDFLLKQICEIFVRNVLIYTPLFFGEKFIIEHVTKKTIESYLYKFNLLFNYLDLDFPYFFEQLVVLVLYAIAALNIICLFV